MKQQTEPWTDAECEDYEERAGILEFEAGVPRQLAEREARRMVEAKRLAQGEG